MAAERYLSRRIPDLRVGNNIDEIDKKLIPASIHPCVCVVVKSCVSPHHVLFSSFQCACRRTINTFMALQYKTAFKTW